MSFDFKSIKNTFNNLVSRDKNILNNILSLKSTVQKIDSVHNELKKKYTFRKKIIGLDSVYFQKILLNNEIANFENLYSIIINRIYADYYNIAKSINKFIKDSNTIQDKNASNFDKFYKYNYLDIKKKYTFEEVEKLFNFINEYINVITNSINNEKSDLLNDVNDNKTYNIDNFLYSCQSDISINIIKLKLYHNYLHYYTFLHETYYDKLDKKIKLLDDNTIHSIIDNNLFTQQINSIHINTDSELHPKPKSKPNHNSNPNPTSYPSESNGNKKPSINMNITKTPAKILQSLHSEIKNNLR